MANKGSEAPQTKLAQRTGDGWSFVQHCSNLYSEHYSMLQFLLRLLCLDSHFLLIVFECHDDVCNQYNIRHECCEASCVGCVA